MSVPVDISHISTVNRITDSSPLSEWIHWELRSFLGSVHKGYEAYSITSPTPMSSSKFSWYTVFKLIKLECSSETLVDFQ
jgi:hypothetical protein